MAWVTVGGRKLDITNEEVVRKMRGVKPEPVREHLVEIAGVEYPPKQVLEAVTGWNRRSYTTLEAVRVLTRVGFDCRRTSDDEPAPTLSKAAFQAADVEQRLSELEAALAVAQAAIARLSNRVTTLEAAAT